MSEAYFWFNHRYVDVEWNIVDSAACSLEELDVKPSLGIFCAWLTNSDLWSLYPSVNNLDICNFRDSRIQVLVLSFLAEYLRLNESGPNLWIVCCGYSVFFLLKLHQAIVRVVHSSGKPGKIRELKSGQGKWIITIIQLPRVLFRQKYATMEFFTW